MPLEMVVFNAKGGAKVTLQILSSTPAFAEPRYGKTTISALQIDLPTATGMKPHTAS